MGMPAKKKAANQNDDRKPRLGSFSAFICAQPFDIPAKEITRIARAAQLGGHSVNSVHAVRAKYQHLRFDVGDPATAFVAEFLASNAHQKAKSFTTANSSMVVLDSNDAASAEVSTTLRVLGSPDIEAIVESVLRGPDDEPSVSVIETEALYRADGPPRKRSGQKSKNSVSIREKSAAQTLHTVEAKPESPPPVQVVEEAKPEPPPPVQVVEEVKPESPPPSPEPKLDLDAQQEEIDDVSQELIDSFEIGDIVHVTQPTTNGKTFTREGRIKAKEKRFATVMLGTITDKIPYKRLSLAPRLSGSGTAHVNSNGGSGGLKVVPKAFQQLRSTTADAREQPQVREAMALAAPSSAREPTSKREPPSPAPAPPAPPAVAPPAASDSTQLHKDFLAWVEMGAAFGPDICAIALAALRCEIAQRTQEIDRLVADRDAKQKQVETLTGHMRLVSLAGGKK